ncbi:hypothetical protein ACIBEK_13770 [Nocardia fusca]|uniref:hypothetical protein n=1 Tax=Nocardia fusca TaxID=941183 RepID=UPI00378F4283
MIVLGWAAVIGLPLGVLLWAVGWPQPDRSRKPFTPSVMPCGDEGSNTVSRD